MDAEPYLSGLEGMEHDHFRQVNLNISDVIDAIQTTDPEFVAGSSMFAGGGASAVQPQSAYIKIVEQPAPKQLRFRYECEGRSAGSIPGVKSTPENKTFPTIQIVGYSGKACVVVSCVTKDPPYRPHPHNLVGKEGCKKGICTVPVSGENVTVSFSNLGIQCVKKKDIDEALKLREEIRVDPFHTGFEHRRQPTSIDLNAVRLCFQVFIEDPLSPARYTRSLPPVVSEPIYDKKAMSDLVICRLSASSCSVAGGQELMLFCEKVAKEDIQVRFYEEKDGGIAWEGYGDFQPTHVHKQVGIAFRTPRYRTLEIDKPVKAWIQLRRPSDGATSEPLPFEFIPLESERKRKIPKGLKDYPEHEKAMQFWAASNSRSLMMPPIKTEPSESPNQQPQTFASPVYSTPSPQPQVQQLQNPNLQPNYSTDLYPHLNIPNLPQPVSHENDHRRFGQYVPNLYHEPAFPMRSPHEFIRIGNAPNLRQMDSNIGQGMHGMVLGSPNMTHSPNIPQTTNMAQQDEQIMINLDAQQEQYCNSLDQLNSADLILNENISLADLQLDT